LRLEVLVFDLPAVPSFDDAGSLTSTLRSCRA
jgi:hypothetical protein